MSYPTPPPPPGYPPAGGPYPYGAPSAPTAPPKHLRGYRALLAMWITLGAAIALFVVGGVVLATKSLGQVDNFDRVTIADGSGTVHLDRTGKWVGYYEASDVTDEISRIPNIQVQITAPDGKAVDLQPYGNRNDNKIKRMTYDIDGHSGAAAFQFTADETGAYTVRMRAAENLPDDAQFAFGPDIEGGTIAGGLLIVLGVLCLVAAIVLLIVGLVRRNGHRSQLRAAAHYAQPAGFGAPGYPGGYPQQPGYPQAPGYPQQPGYPQPQAPGYPQAPTGYEPPPGYQPPPADPPPPPPPAP